MNLIQLTPEEKKDAFREINAKADKIMSAALLVYFAFGLLLAPVYDTWFIALTVGGICVAAYFITKLLLPNTNVYQYVISGAFAIFSAQFIYQMHGLFEMHFFFFVGSAMLITFRNWKLIIPLLLLTVVHHAAFAWLQYSGMREIYFTQLDYMDLQAFLFHAGLAGVIMGICGYWAYDLERATVAEALKALALSRQLMNVKSNIAFALDISKGNLDIRYDGGRQDELGQALVTMRDNLKKSSDRERQEKFVTVGITKVDDVIRTHGDNPDKLADEFIKGVVRYANVNQGALFLEEEDGDGTYLTLASCYAYDRKKHVNGRVNPGEGLVGQCYLERDEIYITQVPKDYIKITSGLGEATPSCVLLVPIRTQDLILGVIELASFAPLQEFEKSFIHKAADNFASAVVSSKTTFKIKKLLSESQEQAEILRSQEEEMRQNMEELAATQEEMARKVTETESRVRILEESALFTGEFDLNGSVLRLNDYFLNRMGMSFDHIKGKNMRSLLAPGNLDYNSFWLNLSEGKSQSGQFNFQTIHSEAFAAKGVYNVIRDQAGRPSRVMMVAIEVEIPKLPESEVRKKLAAFADVSE